MHVHFMEVKERAPDDSRFAKALSCAAFVEKGRSCSRQSCYELREVSISVATIGLLGKRFVTALFDCTLVKMILPRLKSSLAGFCKLNHCWNLFQRKLCIISWLV